MMFNFYNSKRTNKISFNFSSILFISINAILILCIINIFNIPTKKPYTLRKLEDDPRKNGTNMICMQIDHYDLYDLIDLENKVYNITENINLKFCQNIDNYESTCIYKNGETIKKLSGNIRGEEGNYNKVEIKPDGVMVYLSAGENFNDKEKYKVNIDIKCDEKIQGDFILTENPNFDVNNDYILNIKGNSSTACPLKDHYGKEIALGFNIGIGVVLLGVGVYIGIFGYRGRKVGVFFVCIVGLVFVSLVVLDSCSENRLYVKIIVMVVFGLVGIALSIFFIYKQKFLKIYMALVGGVAGYALSTAIINIIISLFNTEHQKLIRIIVCVVLIITGILLGIFVTKGTFIVGTSVIGSYSLMRAFSFFLDKVVPFISEAKIYELATHGNYDKIEEMVLGLFLIYPGMLIVFIVVTIVAQFKLNPKWRDVEDYKLLEKDFDKPLELPEFKIQDDDDRYE